jgi:ABC-2 type transport system ATP-binding protein
MNTSCAIKIENLTKLYGQTKAVDNLNLDVAFGDFLGFLGPNGAGKTTTIRILTGMLRPDNGKAEVYCGGQLSDKEKMKVVGVMPESRGFYDWMTASEYLCFFAQLYGDKSVDKTANEKLLQVGLSERKNSRINTLSRGMKQRLGLARAIINNPKILFLDEPTLGLDPQGQEDIKNLLKKINCDGTTIFFSSHLLSDVAELCSNIAIINQGRLVANGTLEQLRKQTTLPNSDLKDIFLKLTNP